MEAEDGLGPRPPSRAPPLRQQLEAYFSNECLRTNRQLYDFMSEAPDGWVDVDELLGLKQLRAIRATRGDVLRALDGSWLETWTDGASAALRRPPSRPLPAFEGEAPEGGASGWLASPHALSRAFAVAGRRLPAACDTEEGVVATDVAASMLLPASRPSAGKTAGAAAGSAAAAKRPRGEAGLDRCTGVVSTFNLRLGLGKIRCNETGRDVAIGIQDLAGFDVGDAVSFLLTRDPELGTPRAEQLRHAEGSDAGLAAAAPPAPRPPAAAPPPRRAITKSAPLVRRQSLLAPSTPPARGGAGEKDVESPHTPADELSEEEEGARTKRLRSSVNELPPGYEVGTRLSGEIRGFNQKLGLAGVRCAETGRLVRVATRELVGFQVGDLVSFALDAAGQACYVEAA